MRGIKSLTSFRRSYFTLLWHATSLLYDCFSYSVETLIHSKSLSTWKLMSVMLEKNPFPYCWSLKSNAVHKDYKLLSSYNVSGCLFISCCFKLFAKNVNVYAWGKCFFGFFFSPTGTLSALWSSSSSMKLCVKLQITPDLSTPVTSISPKKQENSSGQWLADYHWLVMTWCFLLDLAICCTHNQLVVDNKFQITALL